MVSLNLIASTLVQAKIKIMFVSGCPTIPNFINYRLILTILMAPLVLVVKYQILAATVSLVQACLACHARQIYNFFY